ncbi:MAG: BsuPI-related putative proteinase inhibitor [Bacillota bacterium]
MVRSILIYSLLFMFLCGCSSGNEDTANGIVKEANEVEGEHSELELLFDVSVMNNQAEFIITLKNNSNEIKKLEFPSSQKYEIIVTDENKQEVYRYSEGKMFTQAIEYVLIKPDESMQWKELWEYKKDQVKPGDYEANVSILARDADELVNTMNIKISSE